MKNEKVNLEIGDWVKGESKHGELVHGYIETVNPSQGTVKVTVVASDNVNTIGKTIELLNKVERLTPPVFKTEEEVKSMIDLALLIKDKEWFMELTEKLKSMRINSSQNPLTKTVHSLKGKKIHDQESKNERG